MKTHFQIYLETMPLFLEEESKGKFNKKKKSKINLAKSQALVKNALDGTISVLSRCFNEFPLRYEFKEQIYIVLPREIYFKWLNIYTQLVSEEFFELTQDDNRSLIKATAVADERLKSFIFLIIKQACFDLLDSEGKLNLQVISIFNLQPLLSKFAENSEIQDEIILQLIISYSTQLILPSLMEIIFRRQPIDTDDYKLYGIQVKQSDYLNRYFRELLVQSDDKFQLHFTPFFKNCVFDCIALKAFKHNHSTVFINSLLRRENSEHLIEELKEIESSSAIRHRIVNDIKDYLKAQQPDKQAVILDKILTDHPLGTLLATPRQPWLDTARSIFNYLHSWVTFNPVQPTLTSSISELTTYREEIQKKLSA